MRADEASLWQAFKEQGCQRAREQLILRHMYLVEETRKRAVPNVPIRIDAEDLTRAGVLSLVKAVDRFDPGRGTRFETYAITCIRGAFSENLRQEDWVPRSVRAKQKRGEPVEVFEVVSLDDLLYCGAQAADMDDLSLAETVADPAPGPEEVALARVEAEEVRRAVSLIPAEWRAVVQSYYWGEKTLKQIAGEAHRSESRIHQRHAAGLKWLKEEQTMVQIAETNGRHERTSEEQGQLPEAPEPNSRYVWTPEEEEGLIRAVSDGLSRGQIATALCRSKAAIQGRISLLRAQGRLPSLERRASQPEQAVRRNGSAPVVPDPAEAPAPAPAGRPCLSTRAMSPDARALLGEAMTGVLAAMQSTRDESVMQACGSLLYQIRRVQARLEAGGGL